MKNLPIPHRLTLVGAAVAALPFLAEGVHADFTWNGSGGDDLWTTGMNWDGGTAPGLDLAADNLVFGATGAGQSPDAGVDFYVNIGSLSFTGADSPLTLIGTGSLSFVDGAAITNDGMGGTQTINIDIVGAGDDLLFNTFSGNLVFGGAIDLSDSGGVDLTIVGNGFTTIDGVVSGAGAGIVKSGNGTLILNAANTHDTTEMADGAIVLGDDDALGTGMFTVSGDGSISSDDDSRNIANDITIAGSARLAIGGVDDLELSGAIGGGGDLRKAGSGTLTLSGANTYTGLTRISGGTLSLSGGSAIDDAGMILLDDTNGVVLEVLANETIGSLNGGGSSGGDVNLDGADLFIAETGTSQFDGAITGTGGLDLSGDGVLELNSANTYSGGTTVSGVGATLRLGDDAALGTGVLNVAADATLRPIGGARSIANDLVILTTDLTLAGSDAMEFTGNVDLSTLTADFEITNSEGVEIGGVISNGAFTKSGAGTLTLSGINTYTGDTNIDDGELILTGRIAGDVSVNNGGILSGVGRVQQDLVNRSGGTIEPGENGVGTLEIDGDYDQRNGSLLALDVNAANGASDRLDVTGSATLRDGSEIEATIASPSFIMSGDTFTIIDAAGGVFDDGVTITTTSASMSFILLRGPGFENGDTEYVLQALRADGAFGDAADPGNNEAIGDALDSLVDLANDDPQGDVADLLGQLDMFGPVQLNTAMDELSPEPLNAATAVGTQAATTFTNTQTSYLAARRRGAEEIAMRAGLEASALAGDSIEPWLLASAIAAQDRAEAAARSADPVTVYAQGFGSFGSLDTNGDRTGFDLDSYGGQAGLDVRFSRDLVAGVAIGYVSSDAELNENSGDLDVETFRVGPYFTYSDGGWYTDVSATVGFSNFDSSRNMPLLERTAQADYDGLDVTGYLGVGYEWELDNAWTIGPTLALQYSYFDYDGFTETGGGGANLAVDGRDSDSFRTRLGLAVVHRPDSGTAPTFIELALAWDHEHLDNDDIGASFAAGGTPFVVDTGPRDENAFYIGVGLTSLVRANTALFLRFDGLIGDESDSYSFTGGASIRF